MSAVLRDRMIGDAFLLAALTFLAAIMAGFVG
jgi:hypothetical protein